MSERNKLISSITGNRPGLTEVNPVQTIKSEIETVNSLHNQIAQYIDKSIQNALLIGEILDRSRKTLGHGKFKSWFESNNFVFSLRHAKRYLYLHDNRARLEGAKGHSVSLSMREALNLLSESEKEEKEEKEVNPKLNPVEIYRKWQTGIIISKDEKSALKEWLSDKAESLKLKAAEIEKDVRRLR